MEKLNSWTLIPSRQQSYWEALLLFISSLIVWPYLSFLAWCLFTAVLVAVLVWQWGERQTPRTLTLHNDQWTMQIEQHEIALDWRVGSVRRANLVIWCYGKWPWQRLIIRPDNLPKGEFRTLLYQLALKNF